MEAVGKFLYEFFGQFFEGLWLMLRGVFAGIVKLLNVAEYADTVDEFLSDKGVALSWVIAGLSILIMVALIASIIYAAVIIAKRLERVKRMLVDGEGIGREPKLQGSCGQRKE